MENTASSSTCATMGIGGTGVGDNHVSGYRPHILSTDTPTYLASVFTRTEFTLEYGSETANPQLNGSGVTTATLIALIDARGKPGTYKGTFSGIVVTPNPVTETTNVGLLLGRLTIILMWLVATSPSRPHTSQNSRIHRAAIRGFVLAERGCVLDRNAILGNPGRLDAAARMARTPIFSGRGAGAGAARKIDPVGELMRSGREERCNRHPSPATRTGIRSRGDIRPRAEGRSR